MDMSKQPPQSFPQPYDQQHLAFVGQQPAYAQQQPYAPYPPQPGLYPHPQPPPSYDATQFAQPYGHQNVYTVSQQEAVIVEQPVHILMAPQVGPDPSSITCPSCKVTMVTKVDYETTTKTHIFAALLCLFGCWCCVCVPYCMDSCKNGNHYCSNCGSYIGSYNG